ncbi:hypothetical protein ACMFMG_002147 [Clarireedia jacksonii]
MSFINTESFLPSDHPFHNRQCSPELDGVDNTYPLPSLTPLELEVGPGDRENTPFTINTVAPSSTASTILILSHLLSLSSWRQAPETEFPRQDFKRSLTSFVDTARQEEAELGIRGLSDSGEVRGMI